MNAKKKVLVLLFLAVFVFPFFAQEKIDSPEKEKPQTHFLLGLDGKAVISLLEFDYDGVYSWFGFSPIFYIDAEFQLPINSDFKTYLGVKAMSVIALSNFQLISRFGYAFEKPQNWNKYHVELLGSLSAGIWLGLIEFVSVLPCVETSFQVYLMPDKRGFFVGLGPQTSLSIDSIYSSSTSFLLTFGLELSVGFKF